MPASRDGRVMLRGILAAFITVAVLFAVVKVANRALSVAELAVLLFLPVLVGVVVARRTPRD